MQNLPKSMLTLLQTYNRWNDRRWTPFRDLLAQTVLSSRPRGNFKLGFRRMKSRKIALEKLQLWLFDKRVVRRAREAGWPDGYFVPA